MGRLGNVVLSCDSSGEAVVLRPTTVNSLGHSERFLENVIFNHPEVLGLCSRETGVFGPYLPFRQLVFKTLENRKVIPDIVLLSASGHLIIVEVKLAGNPELRDRRVLSQVIDYAATLSMLDEDRLTASFVNQSKYDTWTELLSASFDESEAVEAFSDLILRRCKEGEVHLVVATDFVAPGLKKGMEAIAAQKSLAFNFRLVQLRPYKSADGGVMFVPNTNVATEIVERTVVTIRYEQEVKPTVTIIDSGSEKPEKAHASTRLGGGGLRRNLDLTQVDVAAELLETAVVDLLSSGLIEDVFSWRGFKLGFDTKLHGVGRCQLALVYGQLSQDQRYYSPEAGVRLRLSITSHRPSARAIKGLSKIGETAFGTQCRFMDVVGEVHPGFVEWHFMDGHDYDPHEMARDAEGFIREMVARLPFEVHSAQSIEASGSSL
jgi:hypothetical protein